MINHTEIDEFGESGRGDEIDPDVADEDETWLRCLIVVGGTTEALDAFETLPVGPIYPQAPVEVVGGYLVDEGATTLGDHTAGPYTVIYPGPIVGAPPHWEPVLDIEWPAIERDGVREYRVATDEGAPLDWITDAAQRHPRLRIALLWANDTDVRVGQVRFVDGACAFREELAGDDFYSFVEDDGWNRWLDEVAAWAANAA